MPRRRDQDPNRPKPTTQKDIAQRCGVHVSTVSLALRDDPQIPQATIDRIKQAATDLAYDPAYYESARRMVLGQHDSGRTNHIVALFFPNDFMHTTFYARIYSGVITTLAQHGYSALTCCVDFFILPLNKFPIPSVISQGYVDGMIAVGHWKGMIPLAQYLRETPGFHTRPAVLIQSRASGNPFVHANDAQGAYLAVQHLLQLGHEHILFMCYNAYPLYQEPTERLAAARKACRDAGRDPDATLQLFTTPAHWLFATDDAVAIADDEHLHAFTEFITAHPEITGILALNDPSARYIWHILRSMGKRVPEDISLVGYDDTDPLLNEQKENILTTVRLPLEELGRQAGQLLLDCLEKKATDTEERIVPVELIVRQTTAAR